MTMKRDWLKDCLLLALLLALVVPLRAWLVYNTEVVARDGIGFIRYALELEKSPWKETLLKNDQHPGYPLTIWAVSLPVRAWMGENNAALQLSAQLASNLAAVLLLFPMYFLGKLFFERRVAFWGTLLLQYLPASGHLFSDGLSDPLFLLLITAAFLFAVVALRRQRIAYFGGSGVFCGLAYLTRPEAVMVFMAVLVVIGLRQMMPSWKTTRRAALGGALAMTLSTLAVGSLYFGFTGTFTNKRALGIMLHERAELRQNMPVEESRNGPSLTLPARRVLFATIFASRTVDGSPIVRLADSVYIFGAELTQLFNYVGMVPLILGLVWRWRGLRQVPEFLVPLTYLGMNCLLMPYLAYKVGYVSERHLLPMGMWGAFFAAAGLCDLTDRLRQRWPAVVGPRLGGGVSLVALLVVLVLAGACLPRTLRKINASGAGNRAAGLWLAQQLKSGDAVQDEHIWSSFYAGRIQPTPASFDPQAKKYVVFTRSKDRKVREQQALQEQELRSAHGEIVYCWPAPSAAGQLPEQKARIVIYAVANKNP